MDYYYFWWGVILGIFGTIMLIYLGYFIQLVIKNEVTKLLDEELKNRNITGRYK